MPGLVQEPAYRTIKVRELHPTFGADIEGVDFSNLSDEAFTEVLTALTKYGFCVFRNTGLIDKTHVEFSRRFGELDNIERYLQGGRKPRYEYLELFDAGNIENDGSVLDPDSPKAHSNRGNTLFHVDSSFNPRRASYCILRAVTLPPPGYGGNTDFADSRTAFDDLPSDLKEDLLAHNYIGAHAMAHSRKLGSPQFFEHLDPTAGYMSRHPIVQKHEPSGRMNLYVGAHLHHIEGLSPEKSTQLIETLNKHATQEKYCISIDWHQPSDIIIWDNRCVLHRAAGGSFESKYPRDMRRTTVHDDGTYAWGVNSKDDKMPGFNTYAPKPVAV
ncbi:hypothetical protein DL769_002342 [Monosporascus sp. CRB-8-3]|nr:hypothetical protein DL769_002342 [Monosporascus sp. CRB-8-3]